jgi:hypothetical protein
MQTLRFSSTSKTGRKPQKSSNFFTGEQPESFGRKFALELSCTVEPISTSNSIGSAQQAE